MFSAVVTTSVLKQLTSTTPCLSARSRHEPKKKDPDIAKNLQKIVFLGFLHFCCWLFVFRNLLGQSVSSFANKTIKGQNHLFMHLSVLLCISLHFAAFLCISLNFSVIPSISLHFPPFRCISLHFSAILSISLHFTPILCIFS